MEINNPEKVLLDKQAAEIGIHRSLNFSVQSS